MVDLMDSYRIINKSIFDVVAETVVLDSTEFVYKKEYDIRLVDTAFPIAERKDRLNHTVAVAHDLSQYVNKFYSIHLDANVDVWLDYLIDVRNEVIDLTEFGELL